MITPYKGMVHVDSAKTRKYSGLIIEIDHNRSHHKNQLGNNSFNDDKE